MLRYFSASTDAISDGERTYRLASAGVLFAIVGLVGGWPGPVHSGELHPQKHHVRKLDQGVYYPNTYYSRSYVQEFPLRPGDRPLMFRLNPFQHYGRYRQGFPIEPDLTDGGFQLDRFDYRYRWDFQPYQPPAPARCNPCDDPRARRWQDLASPNPAYEVGP
jgi:hypothetical protein